MQGRLKKLFKGKLLQLYTQTKFLPNGRHVTLEFIRHPGAALIVPFLEEETVILIRQFRPVIDSFIYELPAGTLEDKESPLHCARREIIEETGYSADKFSKLGAIYPVPGYSTEKITVFKAEGLKKEKSNLEEDEIIEVCKVRGPEVRKLFRKGDIIDAKTICAFSMCGWL
ncbi:MAG: NUDIX domain-containing protein [Candidatus Omnitrophica bacterium]|nr:NUDIX domain-containing protein [Candidatus Omnitrophota bacterium]